MTAADASRPGPSPAPGAGVVARREARHLRALDAGVGARRSRPTTSRSASSLQSRRAGRALRRRRTPSGTRTRCASPTARSPPPPRGLRRPAVRGVRRRLGGRPRAVGSRRLGRAVRRDRRALRRVRDQAQRRLLPVADRRAATRTGRAGTASATSSASWARRCGRGACASASTTRGGLDWTFEDRPIGSVARRCSTRSRAATIPPTPTRRCASSSTRYRPSVLWNDIAWPAGGQAALAAARALLRAGARRRGQRPVDAVESRCSAAARAAAARSG